MMKKIIVCLFAASLLFSCSKDDDATTQSENTSEAATISGGPFEFAVDGTSDFVSGIEVTGGSGESSQWIVTNDANEILGLPGDITMVDFDGAGAGVCFIWYATFNGEVGNLEEGSNTSELTGDYSISNSISVTRNGAMAATISGGPFEFTVDGTSDFVSDIEMTDTGAGEFSQWVVTDDAGLILGLPGDITMVDFDGAGGGVCLIWYLTYYGEIENLEAGNNASDLMGDYALSNSITVTRNGAEAATISGGPFEFTVDGVSDFVSGIEVTGGAGESSQWVVTDEAGEILGLPGDVTMVDFDGAGAGVCLIWYLTFNGAIENAMVGDNASDITGEFALSNSITVTRLAQ